MTGVDEVRAPVRLLEHDVARERWLPVKGLLSAVLVIAVAVARQRWWL